MPCGEAYEITGYPVNMWIIFYSEDDGALWWTGYDGEKPDDEQIDELWIDEPERWQEVPYTNPE